MQPPEGGAVPTRAGQPRAADSVFIFLDGNAVGDARHLVGIAAAEHDPGDARAPVDPKFPLHRLVRAQRQDDRAVGCRHLDDGKALLGSGRRSRRRAADPGCAGGRRGRFAGRRVTLVHADHVHLGVAGLLARAASGPEPELSQPGGEAIRRRGVTRAAEVVDLGGNRGELRIEFVEQRPGGAGIGGVVGPASV